jgi:tryptophan 2,3-dioxygenase
MTHAPIYYGDYLRLERLLSLQSPESAKHGTPVHDEMLFIIVHQAYELWFKQVLHEFERIEGDFSANPVDDEAMARIVHALARVHEIIKLLVAQLDVLETMTPADFLDFRDYLFPASGFQSLQFRLIETRLGLPQDVRIRFDGEAVDKRLSETDCQKLAAARMRPTVLALLDAWLARTPFLDWGGESFRWVYRAAVVKHLSADVETVKADAAIPAERREREARRSPPSSSQIRGGTTGGCRRKPSRRLSSSPSTAKCPRCSNHSACFRCSWTSTRPWHSGATVML